MEESWGEWDALSADAVSDAAYSCRDTVGVYGDDVENDGGVGWNDGTVGPCDGKVG